MLAYVAVRKRAISFKTSVLVFEFEVSSNPGVSMRVTTLPSRVNSSASWNSVVHACRPVPTRRFEPLARLINWRQSDQSIMITKNILLTVVFPLPIAPITLCGNN